ncbi:MAG: acetyl-CoA carboxylase [Ruminiclostridium sp.]|nr:acetyl-CoA carboxylase [Ruminiclostridium sp.]
MEQTVPDSKARERLIRLFDAESFVETGKYVGSDGKTASVVTGYGLIDGAVVYAFSQDISVKGGAVDSISAAKLVKLYDTAVKNGAPVVGIFDSKGGDIAEGAAMLDAYSYIAQSSAKLSGVVPQISLIAGLCAGTAAMIACMADFVVMTEKSEFFMTAPFVSKDDTFEGAGTAGNAARSGSAAIVAKDEAAAAEEVKKLIRILPSNNLELSGNDYYAENDTEITAGMKADEAVRAIADKNSVTELYKDFGNAAYTALGSMSWKTVGFVATDKTEDKLSAADCAKIARFVSFCDSFSIPVVTLLNSAGIGGTQADELAGSVRDAAKLAQVYACATTTKIAVVTDKAYGSAYCAIAPASDMVIAYENSVISAVDPKAAVIFLKGDELNGTNEAALIEEYKDNEASAFTLAGRGSVDIVIDPSETRTTVLSAIDIFDSKRVHTPQRKHINFVY